jgi:hypothetical protein
MDRSSVHSGATANLFDGWQRPGETGLGRCLMESTRAKAIYRGSLQTELLSQSEAG